MPPHLQNKQRKIDIDGYKIPENACVLNEIQELLAAIRDGSTATLEPTVIAIDGPPGAGKSFSTDAIHRTLMASKGTGVIKHGMDRHLKTAPGTPERARLHDSDEDFEELYCHDEEASLLISKLLQARAGSEVEPGRIYSRDHRGHIEGEPIEIPEGGKRIVLFEGTGSINIARSTRADMIGIFIHVDPNNALNAKLQRDLQRGIEHRPEFHAKDIEMATRLRCLPVMKDEGLVYYDNNETLNAAVNATLMKVGTPQRSEEKLRKWTMSS